MNIGDNLRHQFVRLSYSPEIMSMEFTREEMITIYDYIKGKEQEIERLNNILNEFEDFITNVDSHINLGDESEEFILVRDKWLELQELKGVDKE